VQETVMIELATIIQALGVLSACWAIISGVNAWKREFVGKRRIELAEQTLAKFFEVSDAVGYIRNPFSNTEEGKTRQRSERETSNQSELLDRGYIVIERYSKKENIFSDFGALKYRFMASFGAETEQIFTDTFKTVNSIFASARLLAIHYWQPKAMGLREEDRFEKHLEETNRHEGIFWDSGSVEDEIRKQLNAIQVRLEEVTAPTFEEPMSLYTLMTKKLF
jgi:hypothetical protein